MDARQVAGIRRVKVEDRGARPGGSKTPEDEQAIAPQFFFQAMLAVFLLTVLLLGAGLPGRLGLPTVALALSTPTPSPTPVALVTPTPRPTLVVPPTPTVQPIATPTSSPRTYRVGNTGGDGVSLRRSPRLADRLRAWPDNTIMVEVGPETTGDGVTWKQVRDPAGNVGYVPSQYLVPLPPGG